MPPAEMTTSRAAIAFCAPARSARIPVTRRPSKRMRSTRVLHGISGFGRALASAVR